MNSPGPRCTSRAVSEAGNSLLRLFARRQDVMDDAAPIGKRGFDLDRTHPTWL